ncbi:MAG: metallophosphoesterase [Actinomycetota bacterium]
MWVVLAALAGAGACAVLYAWLIERNWFALRRHRVPCLPPGSAPLRVLHVSDLHFRSNLTAMRRFVESLSALKPDLIVGTGDFLGDTGSAGACARMLGAIPARLGGAFVFGSNDYYAPVPKNPLRYFSRRRGHTRSEPNNTWEELAAGLQARGWRLMLNRSERIDGFEVAGLDDPHIDRHDMNAAPPRSPGDEGFRLAVVHSPEVARALAERGFDLIVAGHTHGGQLRLPGFGALVTNTRSLPRRMARGLHRIDGAWLHVSAGMGTSKYAPVRFSCRPEACLLELVPR